MTPSLPVWLLLAQRLGVTVVMAPVTCHPGATTEHPAASTGRLAQWEPMTTYEASRLLGTRPVP